MEDASVEELQKDADSEDSYEPTYLDETGEDTSWVDLGINCDVFCCNEVYLNAHFVYFSLIFTQKLCVLDAQPFILVNGINQLFKPYSIILFVFIEFN